jgi:hypothetical protein
VATKARRVAAIAAVVTLAVLVSFDFVDTGFRSFWDRHAFTASVVANLLVLAIAALVVDEVVAFRQRRQREVSVSVQGLILYGQARRAYRSVVGGEESGGIEELRTFASMLLTASSNLFDDPDARSFLEEVQRFTGVMYSVLSTATDGKLSHDGEAKLSGQMARLDSAVKPLMSRIPPRDRSAIEGDGNP